MRLGQKTSSQMATAATTDHRANQPEGPGMHFNFLFEPYEAAAAFGSNSLMGIVGTTSGD
jgi:hypothetical protein